jgi:hypothetical protein
MSTVAESLGPSYPCLSYTCDLCEEERDIHGSENEAKTDENGSENEAYN